MQEAYYLIDGYNLLFYLQLAPDSLKNTRKTLVDEINKKISALNLQCTIVFDATLSVDSSRSHLNTLEIVFTSQGQTADEWIIEELKLKRAIQKYVVVTGDKQLARLVRQQHVAVQSINEFLSNINCRYKNLKKPKYKKLGSTAFQALNSQEISQPLAPPMPAVERILEGSLEYYLKVFEEKFQKMPQINRPVSLKKFKKCPQVERKDETLEMERWLKIFENKKLPH